MISPISRRVNFANEHTTFRERVASEIDGARRRHALARACHTIATRGGLGALDIHRYAGRIIIREYKRKADAWSRAALIVRSRSDATAASTPSDNEERLCPRTRPRAAPRRAAPRFTSPRLAPRRTLLVSLSSPQLAPALPPNARADMRHCDKSARRRYIRVHVATCCAYA